MMLAEERGTARLNQTNRWLLQLLTSITLGRRRRIMHPSTQSSTTTSLALRVIPPHARDARDPVLMATAMHALVLSERHPVALETAGPPTRRMLIVRPTSQASLEHVAAQLRARYPQADLVPLLPQDDPFVLRQGETISAVALFAAAASHLPLQTSDPTIDYVGLDCLLEVSASLHAIAPETTPLPHISLAPAT